MQRQELFIGVHSVEWHQVPDQRQPFRYLELLHPRSLKHLNHYLASLVEGGLWLKVLIGMFAGLLVGVLLGPSAGLVEARTGILIGNWLALPGQLFLAIIQMIVVPLVVASVIRGLAASENLEQLRQMGLSVTAFFIVTTAIAALSGSGSRSSSDQDQAWQAPLKPQRRSVPRRAQHPSFPAWPTCRRPWWDCCPETH